MTRWPGHFLRRRHRWLATLACTGCALTAVSTAIVAAEAPKLLTTGVRAVGGAASDTVAGSAQTMANAQTQPTTPGGRLPQYQLDHWRRALPTDEEIANPRLRMLLALPASLVLLEASITIDGEPFRQTREERIRGILADLEKPAELLPESEEVPDTETATGPVQTGISADETEAVGESSKSESVPEATSVPAADADPVGEPDSPAIKQPTVPAYSLLSSVVERLRRQIAATGEKVSVTELRWLLTNWVDGPSLLMLHDNFQRFRANERPAFLVLDTDRDGTISAEEIARSVKSFRECDFNRNDIVEYTELERAAADPRNQSARREVSGQTLVLAPTQANAATTYRQLASRFADNLVPRFDANADGRFDESELLAVQTTDPDLSLTINFNTADPSASRLTVSGSGDIGSVAVSTGSSTRHSIEINVAGTPVVFSSVQGAASDQISIGTVMDGYPILPAVDPLADGRFTIRELRELQSRLAKLDRNHDGMLSDDESRATVRVCFGLGPVVHRELAGLRQVAPSPATTPSPPPTPAPSWFVAMDRNRDNDLSRSEFRGNDEQFAILDADNDLLVSAEEAHEFDRKSAQPAKDPAAAGDSAAQPDPSGADADKVNKQPELPSAGTE